MQYIIIGNSAAGLNAAEAIRSRDADGAVTIISTENYPAYSRCLIPYYMEGKVSEEDMLYRPKDYYEANHFNVMLGRTVVSVQPADKTVTLDDGGKLSYDKLMIATGGSPEIPATPGMTKEGVFGFRTTQDLQGILHAAKTAKNAIVMGGGCVGLMAACGLHSQGLKVSVVIKSPHLLSQVADPEAGQIMRQRMEANGVSVYTGADVVEVLGGDKVEGARLDNGETLPCQIIVVGKGVNSNIGLVKGTDIRTHWGIIVDETLKTSIPDVYAAGDVAETIDIVTGEQTVNAIWPAAAEQGRIAGANMAGDHKTYVGSMRMNSAEFFGLPLISTGLVKPKWPGYEILTRCSGHSETFRKVVLKDNVVVGVVLVGEIHSAGVYASLMRKKVDVSSVKDRLLDSNFGFGTVLHLVSEQMDRFTEPEYREAALCAEG
ncbi:MAG: FAD-dependent oxidoreductase [Armatimonadetes bacterium]|nr:FAD-dependent oxidoreductase [Armatimonadota bacterium]